MQEYLNLLRRNHNFRYLWWGNVVSLLGDWFNLIASAALITELTSSGVAISYLFLVRFIPLFLFSPIAGVIADRFNRKHVLIVSDLLRTVTVLGFLFVRSSEQVWMLYVLTAVQFALSALFTPARTAIVANIVSKENLVTANALDSFTWSSMFALGAFVGGVVAALFGVQTAFVMDAMTFVLSALLISRIVVPKRKGTTAAKQTGWLDFVEGFRYLWRHHFLLVIALVKAGGSLVWGAINVIEVTYANDVYPLDTTFLGQFFTIEDGGTATLGIIYVISGLGTGLGPLLLRRRLGDKPPRLILGITVSFVLMTAGILGLAVAPTFPVFLGATFLRTVGTGTLWVFSAVFLQMVVPDRYRGRVFAFEFAALTLTQSLSIFGAGYGLDNLGLTIDQVTLLFGGLGVLVTAVWVMFTAVNRQQIYAQDFSQEAT
ncbi:MAG: MFS transporter [Chloroflexi bacterium]|nr:MFS transporter [Chloroflexota bacterium]